MKEVIMLKACRVLPPRSLPPSSSLPVPVVRRRTRAMPPGAPRAPATRPRSSLAVSPRGPTSRGQRLWRYRPRLRLRQGGTPQVVHLSWSHGADLNTRTPSTTQAAPWAVDQRPCRDRAGAARKGAQGEAGALTLAPRRQTRPWCRLILVRGKLRPRALSEALAPPPRASRRRSSRFSQAAGAKPPAPVEFDPAVLKSYEGIDDGRGAFTADSRCVRTVS